MQPFHRTNRKGSERRRAGTDAFLRKVREATDPEKNGLYDRQDMIEMLCTFTHLFQELWEESEREQREMRSRLCRSPQAFTNDPVRPGTEISHRSWTDERR